MTPETTSKLVAWRTAQESAAAASKEEMRLRLELVGELFNAEKVEGTETLPLPNGWALKAEKKVYFNVKQGDCLDKLEDFLDKIKSPLLEELLRYKAELNVTVYKKALPIFTAMLPAAKQQAFNQLLAEVVTISSGAPALKLIPPAEVK